MRLDIKCEKIMLAIIAKIIAGTAKSAIVPAVVKSRLVAHPVKSTEETNEMLIQIRVNTTIGMEMLLFVFIIVLRFFACYVGPVLIGL